MRSLVVVPTYNEADTIETLLRQVRAAVPDAEVLVVDDASPDGTAAIAEAVGAEVGGVTVLRRAGKDGLGRAYLAGFARGLAEGFEAIVEMDADLSHDPAALPALLAGLADADLVIGSRYVPGGSIPGWSLHRRALSRFGNRYSAAMLRLDVADLTSGFRVFRAELLRDLPLDRVYAGGYGFQIELAYRAARAGAVIAEVPIRFVDRRAGVSKMSWRITVEALAMVTALGVRNRLRRAPAPAPTPRARRAVPSRR